MFWFAISSSSLFEPIQVMCEINGYLIPAMIDTGAEITVMSSSCARKCSLSRAIDPRHSGKVIGVGHSDIIGGIDGLSMRIGPLNFQNRVSILRDSRCDLLIGLDVLERFKCEISLKDRSLRFNVKGNQVRIPIINRALFGQRYQEVPVSEQKARVDSSESQKEKQEGANKLEHGNLDDSDEDDSEEIFDFDTQNISLEGV